MDLIIEFLVDVCILGFYYWIGQKIYGPSFIEQEKKQPFLLPYIEKFR